MKNNILKSLIESDLMKSNDELVEFNKIVSDKQLKDVYKNACPITGEVASNIMKAAADPMNANIVCCKDKATCKCESYILAEDFIRFCGANEYDVYEGAKTLFEAYVDQVPTIGFDSFHVVVPNTICDSVVVRESEFGISKGSWIYDLMTECEAAGIQVNIIEGAKAVKIAQKEYDKK